MGGMETGAAKPTHSTGEIQSLRLTHVQLSILSVHETHLGNFKNTCLGPTLPHRIRTH